MRSVQVSSNKVLQSPPPSSGHLPHSAQSSSSLDVQSTPVGPTAGIAPSRYKPGRLDIFLLGITIVIGGQYFDWNEGFQTGTYSFIIAFFIIGVGYLLLTCCIAEINGALPFAGGAYGLARCTLGFYPAFMIGCCDTTEYIVYVSASVISFAELMVEAAPSLEPYHPLIWALFYVAALAITIRGDKVFWLVSGFLGALSLLFLLLFCLGSLPYVDFAKYAAVPHYEFIGGVRGFMLALPHAAWFFVGIEALSLACDQIEAPKKVIPMAQLSCISIVFVTGAMVVFVTVSLAPGITEISTNEIPFNLGFTRFLNISHAYGALLSLPGAFATSFGFMWAYGKLIAAMSTSRLLLPFCAKTTARSNTPYNALLIGSAWSYALCLLVYFVPEVGESFTGVCMLSAAMSYTGQCVGYIVLKRNYRNIKSSEFRSPFGIAGAFCSLLVWLLMAASLLTVHDDGGIDAMGFTIVVVLFTVFYFCYARKRQTFSPQENKIMLVAHVTKFNIKKVAANRQHRHHKQSSGNSSSHTGNATETSLSERARSLVKGRFSFSKKSSTSTRMVSVAPLSTRSTGSGKLFSPSVLDPQNNAQQGVTVAHEPAQKRTLLLAPASTKWGCTVSWCHQVVAISPNSGSNANAAAGPAVGNATQWYKPGKLDAYLLGVTIVLGGQYCAWNEGFQSGLYSFIIAYFLVGLGYLLLTSCIAEINGALPFAGGAYGLARCTLGFYPAFMIGCCDTTEYIVYVSASVLSFADLVVEAAPSLDVYQPLIWALFYLISLAITIKGDRVFWVVSGVLAVLSLFFLLLFCFGSLPFVSFEKYAAVPELEFVNGWRGFMLGLPHAAWFFVGIEALSLSCDQVESPKKAIPAAQLACILTVFATGVFVVFVTVSLAPGLAELPDNLIPFDLGYTQMFNVSRRYTALLSLPAIFATAFGFMWAYGKLIAAMSTSRLLLPFCAKTTARSNTPYNALLIGSAWSYALCLLVYFLPQVGESFTGVCMLSAAMSYSGQCVGYIMLKRNYKNIKSSEFRSPFGVYGALCSLLVWLLMAFSLLTVHDDGGIDAVGFTIIMLLFTAFYFCYARKRQTFSPQENKIMLVAHVTKFNIKKVASRQSRHQKNGSGSSSNTAAGTESSLGDRAMSAVKSRFSKKSSASTRTVSVAPLSTGSNGSGKLFTARP